VVGVWVFCCGGVLAFGVFFVGDTFLVGGGLVWGGVFPPPLLFPFVVRDRGSGVRQIG